jgi:hypothetical protein
VSFPAAAVIVADVAAVWIVVVAVPFPFVVADVLESVPVSVVKLTGIPASGCPFPFWTWAVSVAGVPSVTPNVKLKGVSSESSGVGVGAVRAFGEQPTVPSTRTAASQAASSFKMTSFTRTPSAAALAWTRRQNSGSILRRVKELM